MLVTKRGFTLIELLVVIAIIALLTAILLPALARAKLLASQACIASNMHQTMLAYHEYSTDNDGNVLLGFLPASPGWTVHDDQYGITVSGQPATRYPWRFLPYIRDWRILFNNTPMSNDTVDSYSYQLSLLPKFGLNSAFVGGDHEFGGFDAAGRPNPAGGGGGSVVFREIDVKQPSSLIVFAETACYSNGKPYSFGANTLPANCPPEDLGQYFQLVPPMYGTARIWHADAGASQGVAADVQSIMGVPYGVVKNQPVVGFFDGHAEAMKIQALQDMRLWCNSPQNP